MNTKIFITGLCFFIALYCCGQEWSTENQGPKKLKKEFCNTPWNPQGKHLKDRNHKFAPWSFIKTEESFIIEKANLTGVEANFLFPLFHKKKELMRQNDEKIRTLGFRAHSCNLTEKSADEIIKKINGIHQQNEQIEQEYQAKILKGISAVKYLRVLNADHQFDRMMLRRMMMDSHKGMFMKKPNTKNKD